MKKYLLIPIYLFLCSILITTLGCGAKSLYEQSELKNVEGTVINYATCEGCYQYVIDVKTDGIIWHLFDPQLPNNLKVDSAKIKFSATVIKDKFQSVKRQRDNKSMEHIFYAQEVKVTSGEVISQ